MASRPAGRGRAKTAAELSAPVARKLMRDMNRDGARIRHPRSSTKKREDIKLSSRDIKSYPSSYPSTKARSKHATIPAPSFGELNEVARKRVRRAVGQYGLMDNERDPKDNYETPPDAVHQLLGHVKLAGGVWDPSCGRGAILKALLEANVGEVVGSDKHVHDMREGVRCHPYVVDFMDMTKMPDESVNIVMNPPFDQADDHVRHALRLVPSTGMVCVLLRLTWIAAKKRADLLSHLHRIIICGRLKMLPPDVVDQGHNGAVDFAWFVFVPRSIDATHIVRAK